MQILEESENHENEAMIAMNLERHRLDLLGNIAAAIFSGAYDEKITQDRILKYTDAFGTLPNDLQILLEQNLQNN